MGLFDGVSAGLDDWSKSSLNSQLGGGCPLCKGDNTLDRKTRDGKVLLVCSKCGAAFDNVFFKGLRLVAGDRRYLGQILPASIWRIVRLLPAGDSLLALYSDGSVRFFATELGVVRVKNSAALLKYSDITGIFPASAWVMSVYYLASVLLFFVFGIASAAAGVSLVGAFGLIYSLVFFCVGAVLLFFGRKEVYQLDSPVLSGSERRAWRITKPKSKDAQSFVSLVRERLA